MFIFLEADGFSKRAARRARYLGDPRTVKDNKRSTVRRPYRGIQIKDDTYATLSVVRADGKAIPLVSSSAEVTNQDDSNTSRRGLVNDYSDFILQNIQDQRAEKQQIVETFGEPFIYFFGERPRMVTFSGMLINTEDFNWRSQFWENYDKFLRGTKLVQANARVYLTYDTILIEGYPLTASAQDVSDRPYEIPFSMQMFVTAYYDFSSIGQTRYPGAHALPDTKALNKELSTKRGQFVSTTAAVRQANIESRGPKGILAELRAGIKGLNNLATLASNYVQTASQTLGGRVVRLPVGAAGYLASIGSANLSAGVLSVGDAAASQAFGEDLTNRIAAFQQLVATAGAIKLRVPSAAQYAPSWTSSVDPGSFRGYFWENIDEYPERGEPQRLMELISDRGRSDLAEILDRSVTRRLASAQYQAMLETKLEELARDGGSLQDIAERVAFAKSNFGMVMNAKAFVTDPAGVGRAVVGLPASNETVAQSLAKRGVLLSAGQVGQFVGSQALQTFQQTSDSFSDSGSSATLGSSYNQGAYSLDSGDSDYEAVYGGEDYTGLVATAPEAQSSLQEAYGDKNAPTIAEVEPEILGDVYPGTTEPAVPSIGEQALSGNVAGVVVTNPEDVSGIRGVEDDDAGIDPVV